MASAVPLRGDYGAGALRELAKRCASGSQTRRLLALAEIYDGGTRGDAARIGGVGLQTVRALRHGSAALDVPANITLLPLPPRSPELNPVENVWQFMRDNWLSNRVFTSYDDILDHCCHAWNRLVDQPWIIMSIGLREWAHRL